MHTGILSIAHTTAKGGIRNRLLLAVFFMGAIILVGLQIMAGLSMRQPYQAAMAYNLAAINVIGILLTLFLGVNLISQELNSRVAHPILAQPVNRSVLIYGQFFGLCTLIVAIIISLGTFGAIGLYLVEY